VLLSGLRVFAPAVLAVRVLQCDTVCSSGGRGRVQLVDLLDHTRYHII
jgi:hypothetical protein